MVKYGYRERIIIERGEYEAEIEVEVGGSALGIYNLAGAWTFGLAESKRKAELEKATTTPGTYYSACE